MTMMWDASVVMSIALLVSWSFALCVGMHLDARSIKVADDATGAPPFYITTVSKEERGSNFKVRVEYQAQNAPAGVVMWFASEPPRKLTPTQPGVVEVEVPRRQPPSHHHHHDDDDDDDNSDSLQLDFYFDDSYYFAFVYLRHTPRTMTVPVHDFRIGQGSDVTFPQAQAGSDVVLDVHFRVEGDREAVAGHVYGNSVLVQNRTTGERVTRYRFFRNSPVSAWTEWDSQRQLAHRHGHVTVSSSVEGQGPDCVLDVMNSLVFHCPERCLLSSVHAHLLVQVHSQARPSPFPVGFAGFVHSDTEGDPAIKYCSLPTGREPRPQCLLLCEVAGDRPSAARLVRLLPNGDITAVDDVRVAGGWWSKAMLLIPNATLADAGQFRCLAETGGREMAMDVRLVVVRKAVIDHDASYAWTYENGSVAAVCVAEGSSAPDVTYGLLYMYGVSTGEYVITVTQVDEHTTRAEIFIRDPAKARGVDSLHCFASSSRTDSLSQYDDSYTIKVFNII